MHVTSALRRGISEGRETHEDGNVTTDGGGKEQIETDGPQR